ncbi:MAG: hypothetical protein DRO99_02295 [Candidatus Aenigmatarchaeota archaeon]|nr:MAG: hypothetical protein DRO99_02295 [Candidatus Aenigmarchaeota archaeon]
MTLESMHAERKKPATGEINVNSTPTIKGIREVSVSTLNKKALEMSFEFVTKYDPDIGEIKIGGNVLYLAEKNAPILKQWKSKKSVPEEVSVEVLNHLFRRCLLKMAGMAEDLQLPPPLQLPRVKQNEK